MFTCLKTDENSDFVKQAFNLECEISVSISGVLLRVFVRTSVPWHVLDVFKFKISFNTSICLLDLLQRHKRAVVSFSAYLSYNEYA